MSLITDFRFALRSLARVKGLAITVVVTLALGIGANAAIFSVVRGVLLRPLVNRDEDRLIYIRQSARGIGAENANFSVPEIRDLRVARQDAERVRRFLDRSSSRWSAWASRAWFAPASSAGSYFERHGAPPGAGPPARRHRRRAQGGRRRGADASLLDDHAAERPVGDRKDGEARRPLGDHRRRPRAVGPVSGGDRDHRERRDEPAPPGRDDGGRPRASDDRALRPAGARRRSRGRARRAARRPRRDPQGASRRRIRQKADFRIDAVRLRDQITSPARTVLLVLLAASALVFVIACSNVANLILARSVRREGELAIRAALGASTGALRRTLLAESLLLCGAGAILGVVIARPMVAILARYAARFSVRALDLTVDASLLWVGVSLAVAAAVLLAFVPRLPSAEASNGIRPVERKRADHVGHEPPAAPVRGHADCGVVRAAGGRRDAADDAVCAAGGAAPASTRATCSR